MVAEESSLSNICIAAKVDDQFKLFKERQEKEAAAYIKTMDVFTSLENELDHLNENEEGEMLTRRRKAGGYKSFEFHGVSYKDAMEDLNDIYGAQRAEEKKLNFRNFKKNDCVSCVLDKKKYKGTIIQVSQKGLIIKTKDRRKIRVSWEDVDDEEVKIAKLDSLE